MRLRNKKTGEIVDYDCFYFHKVNSDGHEDFEPNTQTLAELSEEWEDYRVCFFIGYDGYIYEADDRTECEIKDMGGIGNGFETREEAEKAVEKLKAWKRLKDKGFRFTHYHCGTGIIGFEVPDSFFPKNDTITDETEKDLGLLFGGEE